MKDEIYPLLMISEIRTIAADKYWVVPCNQQDSVTIHFTWKQKPDELIAFLPKIEAALAIFNLKPHWVSFL
jgi:xylitol oxidase